MMPDQPLVVPLLLDALVVNRGVLARDEFRWWQFNYLSLNHYRSPEPLGTDRSVGGAGQGVTLHWTLPDALRHAPPVAGPSSGASNYPLVPNRWLIARVNGTTHRQVTAWVVESDCPFTAQTTTAQSARTSLYLADPALLDMWRTCADPIRNAAFAVRPAGVAAPKIGVPFPLQDWKERAPQTMFLTAVAPANPLFSVYTAHNIGVFSFQDDLTGIDNDQLSYFIFGWYSDAGKDILSPANIAAAGTSAALLDQLMWSVDGGAPSFDSSVYHGAVLGIDWQRTGPAPAGDPLQAIRDSGKLNVAIGNTTIDAFTALIAKQIGDPAKAELLRAFQYDFLQQLNQVNGAALLDEKVRQAWFASKAGGFSWTIVENESDGSTTTTLTDAEASWLFKLNADQAALDAALTALHSLQWDLHALWLKQGYLADSANTFPQAPTGVNPPGLAPFRQQLAAQLDPGQAGSTAARLVTQFAVVQELLGRVPQPIWAGTQNAQQALLNGIQAFAKGKGLNVAKTLKAKAAPRYWRPNNPVVIVSGVQPPPSAVSRNDLPVRQTGQLMQGLTVNGAAIDSKAVSGLLAQCPNLGAVPATAQAALTEFFLLDPGNAALIAAASGQSAPQVASVISAHDPVAMRGVLPAIDLGPWQQPWEPMFLEWSTTYSYVPFNTGTTPWWVFDGTDYRLVTDKTLPVPEQRTVSGISLLSPHANFVFGKRLDDFVKQFGTGSELAQIDHWVEQVYGWKFLAQELTGFNDMLAGRDLRAFRRPSSGDLIGGLPVAALAGYGDGDIPASLQLPPESQGAVTVVPLFPNGPPIPFHGGRQGQFSFTNLNLYDKFGRVLYVIQAGASSGLFDAKNFPMLIDPALLPDRKIAVDVASVVQLPPRLLQGARLDFRLLDAADDSKVVEVDSGVMPIAGWVLPNHLDGSILVYAPDGTALGEFRLLAQADGSKLGQWQSPPHSTMTLDGVAAAAPHLHAMLTSKSLQTEAGFQAFLASIDTTLWTTDPLGNRVDQNLSVLVGRPLALLRARLQFELDGHPISDTGWAATFTAPTPEFLATVFSIRLGDQATREDGLIGYFTAANYDVFNSVAAPATAAKQDYVQPIGGDAGNYLQLGCAPGTQAFVTLLADPRAAVHAASGVLPIKQLDIPQQFVDQALSAMEISFRMGPVMTVIVPTPQGDSAALHPNSIVYPLPTEQNGAWSWWEPDAKSGNWTGYDLVNATADAKFPLQPNSVREGYLQFVTNLKKQ
jgi:hypothetical protein